MTGSGPTVLVVDDEEMIASTLAIILRQSDFVATSFNNPVEALQSAAESAPDFLLAEVLMPQMTGFDLAIQIQRLAPQCKVLLFSGRLAATDLIEKAQRENHHFALLAKPFHPAVLLSRLRTL